MTQGARQAEPQSLELASAEAQSSTVAARLLILGGVLLLALGGLFGYPYLSSRLAVLPGPDPSAPKGASQSLFATAVVLPSPPASSSPATPVRAATEVPVALPPTGAAKMLPPTDPVPTATPAAPTRIVIPAIGVDAPVIPISWETQDVEGQLQAFWDVPDEYAGGWHETSAPLGVPGNTVVNGHNTNNGEVFRDLYTLEAGAPIIVYSGDAPYTYVVSETLILPEAGQPLEVRQENARYILPTTDERLTLVTCHPYGSLRYRLIVIARPMPDADEDPTLFIEP
jgi:sortase A